MNKYKHKLILLFIILLAGFLRFWKLGETMGFIGDFGWYYLQARDLLINYSFPLVGISSSVPILHQGPLWTYLLAVALYLGNYNPIAGGILGVVFGVLGVIGTYLVTDKIWGRSMALSSSMLAATTPFIVFHDRIPYHTTVIFPLTVLFFYLIWRLFHEKRSSLAFALGLTWGLLFQSELATFILLPILCVVYLIKQVKFNLKTYLSLLAGIFWGTLPFLVYDFRKGVFIQTIGFAVWVLSKIYYHWIPLLGLSILGIVSWKKIKQLSKLKFQNLFICIWTLLGVSAFIIRGVYSEAYMPIIYYPLLIIGGILFDYLMKRQKYIGYGILTLVIAFNIYSILSTVTLGPSIFDQEKVVDMIIEDADSVPFGFIYSGPGNQFASGDNNWQYLFWWKGSSIVPNNALRYAVVAKEYRMPSGYNEISKFGHFKVGKKEKEYDFGGNFN